MTSPFIKTCLVAITDRIKQDSFLAAIEMKEKEEKEKISCEPQPLEP